MELIQNRRATTGGKITAVNLAFLIKFAIMCDLISLILPSFSLLCGILTQFMWIYYCWF